MPRVIGYTGTAWLVNVKPAKDVKSKGSLLLGGPQDGPQEVCLARKGQMPRKKKKETADYWNKRLIRLGLSTENGRYPRKLIYVGGMNRLDIVAQESDGVITVPRRKSRRKKENLDI